MTMYSPREIVKCATCERQSDDSREQDHTRESAAEFGIHLGLVRFIMPISASVT